MKTVSDHLWWRWEFKVKRFRLSSPLRHAGLDAAGAAQSGQGVLPVGPMTRAAQAHVDGLAAGVHAADGGVPHAASPAVTAQGALPALGWGAAEGGAPRQAVGGASGGVDWARTGGLWRGGEDIIVFESSGSLCILVLGKK